MTKSTVIRIIKYEGDETAVRKAIQLSKSLGKHSFPGGQLTGSWSMVIAEHYNDLPKPVELTEEEIERSMAHERLTKLLGYMASNVKEGGWEEVEKMGGVASWMGFDDALQFLDALPVCNAGLMEKAKWKSNHHSRKFVCSTAKTVLPWAILGH